MTCVFPTLPCAPRRPRRRELGLAAGLLLAASLGCGGGGGGGTGTASAPPPIPPPTYDLVFDGRNGDGSHLLYQVRPEGGAPQVLGLGYGGTRPHARPDGRALVYASLPTDLVPAQLMLVDDLTQPAICLSTEAGVAEREVVWAPDGLRLAFHSQLEDPAGDIFTADLRGRSLENRRNLTPRQAGDPMISPDVTPAWSPDGTRLAFTSYRQGSPALWLMNADGSGARQLTPTSSVSGDYFPTWSPDGRWIAFQRLTSESAQIGILPAAGGTPTFLPFAGKAYAPAWSPDGGWIAFSGLVDGEYDIHLQTPDGRGLRRIPRAGEDRGPSWIRRADP